MILKMDLSLALIFFGLVIVAYLFGRSSGKKSALVEIYSQSQAMNEMEMMSQYVNSLKRVNNE